MKITIFFFGVTLVSVLAIESNFYREEPCAQADGFCLLESECPHAVEAEHKSLCSGQKKDGAVCCRGFPQSEVNCFQLHNDCMERCPRNLNLGKKGCSSGKTCCVLTI